HKTQHKDKHTTEVNIPSRTVHYNKWKTNLFLSILLFILQDWLYTMKSAEVSCTQFCSKTTQVHSPTKKIDFELGSLSCMKEFT
ncbi:hypothetical protein, partial [Thiolapillus sp.]|uniref:hypothetical protein n=1 Tax=Thiolapillus sp. TaxID=2017437 RepID=UPI003AF4A4CA